MNTYVKQYLVFLAFAAVTAAVVRPAVKNIPVLNQI
jgi:hypothetical protein